MPIDLVLLRHGQSVWNHENLFTGWTDVPLTEQGHDEAVEAGRLMAAEGLTFDVLHTSLLARAIDTAHLALGEMGLSWIEEKKHWRLNERHYGALQGLDKAETARRHGLDQVKIWRRAYDIAPPPVGLDSEHHPANDPRYAWLPPEALPATECLADVVARLMPYWYDAIVPDLRLGRRVLIAAHGNSLRALIKHLDGLTDDEIVELNVPTGVPLVYRLDDDLQPVSHSYLGDPEAVAAAARAVADQATKG